MKPKPTPTRRKPATRNPQPATLPPIIRLSAPIDERDMERALASLADEHPAWKAVLSILDREIENAIAQVSMPDLADKPGPMAHVAGGIEWLRSARYRLEAVRDEGRKEKV